MLAQNAAYAYDKACMSYRNDEDWRTPKIVTTGTDTAEEQSYQLILHIAYFC